MYHVLKRKHNTIGLLGVDARGMDTLDVLSLSRVQLHVTHVRSRVLEGRNARFGANIPRTRN